MAETSKQEGQSKEQYPVKRICAYCQKELGNAEYKSDIEGEISHGICAECEKKVTKEFDEMEISGENKEK